MSLRTTSNIRKKISTAFSDFFPIIVEAPRFLLQEDLLENKIIISENPAVISEKYPQDFSEKILKELLQK